MRLVRHCNGGQAVAPFLCRILCVCTAWVQAATALPQGAPESNASLERVSSLPSTETTLAQGKIRLEISQTDFDVQTSTRNVQLIPSGPPQTAPASPTGLIPSQPPSSPSPSIISSQPPGLIRSEIPTDVPSQPSPTIIQSQTPTLLIPSQPPGLIPSQPPSGLIPSNPPTGLIPSGSLVSPPGLIPTLTAPLNTGTELPGPITGGSLIPTGSMRETTEGLKPIPGPTTAPGNPNGHHEISEPNFTVTVPCRGCSPVIELPATGFDDETPTTPIADHAGPTDTPDKPEQQPYLPPSPPAPPKVTITAGPSPIIISKEPTGGNFIIDDSTTVTPGQTVTFHNTPFVIQTGSGRIEIVVIGPSTKVIQVTAEPQPTRGLPAGFPFDPQNSKLPILPPLTIGTQTITANPSTQYIISEQTLQPGGPAITVSGTTLSLLPSASAIVINHVTTTLAQVYGQVVTTTYSPLLTLGERVITANRAGYYVLAPGTTLIAGGPAVTVSGTTISLEPQGTVAVIQGSTSVLTPATTIVTLTKSFGGYGDTGRAGSRTDSAQLPLNTNKASDGYTIRVRTGETATWLEGAFVLVALSFGWLSVWL